MELRYIFNKKLFIVKHLCWLSVFLFTFGSPMGYSSSLDDHVTRIYRDLYDKFDYDACKLNKKYIDKEIISKLFSKRLNESNASYTLENLSWETGQFSKRDITEALVYFEDHSQSHSTGWAEIWLLRLIDNEWRVIFKLADGGDKAWFECYDLDNDGKKEVWLTECFANQGEIIFRSRMVSIFDDFCKILFANDGFDKIATGFSVKAIKKHKMGFFDIDNDRVKEIIDLEITIDVEWKGEGEAVQCKVINISEKQNIYKFNNNIFTNTKFTAIE